MMKRLLSGCVLLILLASLFSSAAADVWTYPAVFSEVNGKLQLNLDQVVDPLQNDPEYQQVLTFAATRFTVTGTLPKEAYDQPVWLQVWRVDKEELVYSGLMEVREGYGRRWFESGVIQTPYAGQQVTQYRVDLIAGEYHRSVTVNRELIYLKNNTVSAMGIRFRDLDEEFVREPITDKWYMFTPVDLYSLSPYGGTMTIPLFASNMYVVGSLTVTRQGDVVYVQAYPDMDVYMRSCYVAFFENLSAVQPDMLSNSSMRRHGFAPGTPVFIQNHLGGRGSQLLYFSAIIDFDPNTKEKIDIFYDRDAVREMKEMLRNIEWGMSEGVG